MAEETSNTGSGGAGATANEEPMLKWVIGLFVVIAVLSYFAFDVDTVANRPATAAPTTTPEPAPAAEPAPIAEASAPEAAPAAEPEPAAAQAAPAEVGAIKLAASEPAPQPEPAAPAPVAEITAEAPAAAAPGMTPVPPQAPPSMSEQMTTSPMQPPVPPARMTEMMGGRTPPTPPTPPEPPEWVAEQQSQIPTGMPTPPEGMSMPDPADMPMPPMDAPGFGSPYSEMDDDFGYPMEPWMYPSPRYYRYQQPYRSYNYGYRRSYGPGYQREQSYSYPPGISRSWEGPAPYGYRWRRYYPGTQ